MIRLAALLPVSVALAAASEGRWRRPGSLNRLLCDRSALCDAILSRRAGDGPLCPCYGGLGRRDDRYNALIGCFAAVLTGLSQLLGWPRGCRRGHQTCGRRQHNAYRDCV